MGLVAEAYDLPLGETFWKMVDVGGPDECWPWCGSVGPHGRGLVSVKSGMRRTTTSAPRVAWELHRGKRIPEGMRALHTCDNPNCVNPAHIWIGTQSDNMADMAARGRVKRPKVKTHCKHGHELTPENTGLTKAGAQVCKTCSRDRVRVHLRKKRAALRSQGLSTRGKPLSHGWHRRLRRLYPPEEKS